MRRHRPRDGSDGRLLGFAAPLQGSPGAGRGIAKGTGPATLETRGTRDGRRRLPTFRFSDYADCVRAGWTGNELERFILRDLPRKFHGLSRRRQQEELERGVGLTGTRWDALIAAMAEQLALTHDLPVPAWVDEPERFLDETWVLAQGPTARQYCLMFAPGPFLRHGAVPDPDEFDERTGDTSGWGP